MWVFGCCDRFDPCYQFAVHYVTSRKVEVLEPLLRPHLRPGMELHTDAAPVYARMFNDEQHSTHLLTDLQISHTAHSHSNKGRDRFEDTSMIEGLWSHLKNAIRRQYVHVPAHNNFEKFL